MANSTTSPNMGLIVPIVGVDPGPDWANNLNASLSILDSHNHTSGQGVQIPTAGLNINTDLPINGNNIKTVKTVNFTAQSGTLAGASPNLGCIYVAGNELVYNDEAGHVVAITNNGSVNSGAGSITGLPSGTASATFNSGSSTFVWQSATSTPASMDGGNFIFRNISASSKGVTVKAPASLAADYSIVWPLLPANTSFVTIDNAGNMGTGPNTTAGITSTNIAAGGVSQANLAARSSGTTVGAGGVAVSAGSGSYSTGFTTPQAVTNLSVTITTTGRPVRVQLQGTGAAPPNPTSTFGSSISLALSGEALISPCAAILNGSTIIGAFSLLMACAGVSGQAFAIAAPASSINTLDMSVNGAPGTYTYSITLQETGGGGANASLTNAVLVAYEI